MKLLPIILLAVACQAYMPIAERSWVKFRKVKDPTYENIPLHGEPDICNQYKNKYIKLLERIETIK